MPSNWIEVRDHAAGVTGLYGPDEILAKPPPQANYRKAEDQAKSCDTCIHYVAGICHFWGAKVKPNFTCDDWKASVPNTMSASDGMRYNEVFLGGEDAFEFDDESGLYWKPILKTGVYPTRPGKNGRPVREPLVVRRDSRHPDKEVSFKHIVQAFDDGAKENVTIPLSHDNNVEDNTGFIQALKIVEDKERPGEHILLSAHKFTEPDIEAKVKRGSIKNNSAGIEFGYTSPTGQSYSQVLDHVCLTNKPFFRNLAPFGIHASEVDYFEFDANSTNDGEVMWDQSHSYEHIRDQIQKQLPQNPEGGCSYWIMGMTGDQVLLGTWNNDGDQGMIAGYVVDELGNVELEDPSMWEPVSRKWISVSLEEETFQFTLRDLGLMALEGYPVSLNFSIADERPLGTPGNKENWVDQVGGLPKYVRRIARNLIRERGFTTSHAIATAIERIKVWAVKSKNPKTKLKASAALAEWEEKKARSHARSLLSSEENDYLDDEGVNMAATSTTNTGRTKEEIEASELDDENDDDDEVTTTPRRRRKRTRVEASENGDSQDTSLDFAESNKKIEALQLQLEESERKNEKTAFELHKRNVRDRVEGYKKTWGDQPAFLKKLETILMADRGEVTFALNLSEDGTGEAETYTITEILDEVMEAMPRETVKLSEQHQRFSEGEKPGTGEEESVEARVKRTKEYLRLPDTLDGTKRRRKTTKTAEGGE